MRKRETVGGGVCWENAGRPHGLSISTTEGLLAERRRKRDEGSMSLSLMHVTLELVAKFISAKSTGSK